MGFRFRKSISFGKGVRVNIGKKGVTSVTFGKRGTPHVTVGKNGTRAGMSIPGTGLSYETRLDKPKKKTSRQATKPAKQRRITMKDEEATRVMPTVEPEAPTQIIDATVAPEQTAQPSGDIIVPPTTVDGGGDDGNDGGKRGSHKPKKKGIVRRILKIIAWAVAFLVVLCIGFAAGGTPVDPTTTTQYKELQQQLTSQQEKTKDVQSQLDELTKKVGDLDALQKQLDQQKSEQEETQKKLDEQQKTQEQKQSELDQREKNIAQREAEKKQKEQEAIQAAQQQEQQQSEQSTQQTTTEQSQSTTTPQQSTNVHYANCSAVRAAGKAPLYKGEPGYSSKLDRDGDGVACE
ncbi:DUF4236 domain-containing protein [Bifidobacterium miconis]|uniref:DUF4236 domain-containing protein n=1 Tax=Bifidobacterium miconis TaxID=2834435 RepID=UPI001F175D1D|nr:DUF4236 domain-containing protein [Bifidobacterium miconis]